jgi:hypothetical protein
MNWCKVQKLVFLVDSNGVPLEKIGNVRQFCVSEEIFGIKLQTQYY